MTKLKLSLCRINDAVKWTSWVPILRKSKFIRYLLNNSILINKLFYSSGSAKYSGKPIPKEISKLHKCFLGGKSSRFIISRFYQVNVISSILYEKLVASKEFACSGYDKVPGCMSGIQYEGAFEAYIRTAPGNHQRALFYIQRGTDDFIILLHTLLDA